VGRPDVHAPRVHVLVLAAGMVVVVDARPRQHARAEEEHESRGSAAGDPPTTASHRSATPNTHARSPTTGVPHPSPRRLARGPARTIGPAGAAEPAAGSTDTANAVTSLARSTCAPRPAIGPVASAAKSPAGAGASAPRMAQSSYTWPAGAGPRPDSTTAL